MPNEQDQRREKLLSELGAYGSALPPQTDARDLFMSVAPGAADVPEDTDPQVGIFVKSYIRLLEQAEKEGVPRFNYVVIQALGRLARQPKPERRSLHAIRETREPYPGLGEASLRVLHVLFGDKDPPEPERA